MYNAKSHNLPYTPEWLAQFIGRWISRREKNTSSSFSITRKNIYILPSKAGWLFITALIAILSGAINYNNSMVYLLCFFLASLGFIGMIMTHKNLRNISIYSRPSAATFPGKTINYQFTVKSDDINNHFTLQTNEQSFSVTTEQDAEFCIREKAQRRGRQNPSRFKIYTEFPLGLFHAWAQVNIENTVIVYPKPVKHHKQQTQFYDNNPQQRNIDGDDEFAGIRDFMKGDSPKSLAWKTIARTHQLYTKEFNTEVGDIVLFDFDQLNEIQNTEEKLSILCELILQANTEHMSYGLKLPNITIKPGHGSSHLHHCLSALALY